MTATMHTLVQILIRMSPIKKFTKYLQHLDFSCLGVMVKLLFFHECFMFQRFYYCDLSPILKPKNDIFNRFFVLASAFDIYVYEYSLVQCCGQELWIF